MSARFVCGREPVKIKWNLCTELEQHVLTNEVIVYYCYWFLSNTWSFEFQHWKPSLILVNLCSNHRNINLLKTLYLGCCLFGLFNASSFHSIGLMFPHAACSLLVKIAITFFLTRFNEESKQSSNIRKKNRLWQVRFAWWFYFSCRWIALVPSILLSANKRWQTKASKSLTFVKLRLW